MSVSEASRPTLGPTLLERRSVRAATELGRPVRCGLIDISLADIPTSVVFFYPGELDFAVLAAGLSIALGRLPVFAGRLSTVEDELLITGTDAGVPFQHVQADETLASAVARTTRSESGLVEHVRAQAARTEELPLFTAQLSRLADGSSALGISWHHAVGDFQSVLLLMRAWSAAVAQLPLPQPVLVQDRDAELLPLLPATDSGRPSFRLPADPEEVELIRQTVANAPLANRSVQLYFSDDELIRMRTALSGTTPLSINDVICGHLVATLWDLAENDQERRLAVPVNARRHLGLPAELVGNLLGEIVLTLPAYSTSAEIATAVRAGIDTFARNHFSGRANQEYLAQIGRSQIGRCIPIGFDPGRRTVVLSNWSRFGIYDVSFGGRTPIAFCPVATSQIAWAGSLVEGFGGEGLLGTIALPARLAGLLRKPEGQAALHRYRSAEEELPALASVIRKLA